MQETTGTDQASIPTENERDGLPMSRIMQRKAIRTISAMPSVVESNSLPPSPSQQVEDLPSTNRPRLQTSTVPTCSTAISPAVDANISDPSVTTFPRDHSFAVSPFNPLAVEPAYVVIGAANVPSSRPSKVPLYHWTPKYDTKLTVIPGCVHKECGVRRIVALKPNKALKSMSSEKEKMGKWTEEEDIMLTRAVAEHGCDWVAIAALVPGRTNTKCRQHWVGTDMEYGGKDQWVCEQQKKMPS
jgi:hypothetical protein